MIRYLDTSAALKLLVQEAETDALAIQLTAWASRGDRLVASMLLLTELHCAARRRRELDPHAVQAVLDAVLLVDIARDDLLRAASSAWGLRSADAIHLATALRLDADELIAYDRELLAAAQDAGLRTTTPG
ncbi:MAG: type II toxin-antitoxin system VapC family toxin [Austwickia sp.]|nr:type II toxin-antitoxin system VapC family toxin [Austwickia sp.]MBK8437938.1 type II toxin-antitoxin system VapC family toxin [Austwickia sp.]MBK9100237.1 type II toxin-antitoxin system VapC family toxin [Austwickia sp.]